MALFDGSTAANGGTTQQNQFMQQPQSTQGGLFGGTATPFGGGFSSPFGQSGQGGTYGNNMFMGASPFGGGGSSPNMFMGAQGAPSGSFMGGGGFFGGQMGYPSMGGMPQSYGGFGQSMPWNQFQNASGSLTNQQPLTPGAPGGPISGQPVPAPTPGVQPQNPFDSTPGVEANGFADWFKDLFGGGGIGDMFNQKTTTTIEPWKVQAGHLDSLMGKGADEYKRQMALGPLGFDPASRQALQGIENIAGRPNQLLGQSMGAVTDIAGGQQRINTGGMFGDIYGGPGITADQKINQLYGQQATNTNDDYSRMAQGNSVNESGYQKLLNSNAAGEGGFRNILQGQGAIGNERQYNQLYNDPTVNANIYNQFLRGADPAGTGGLASLAGSAGTNNPAAGRLNDLWNTGGATNQNQYNSIYGAPGVQTDIFSRLAGGQAAQTGGLEQMANAPGAGVGNLQDLYSNQGPSLTRYNQLFNSGVSTGNVDQMFNRPGITTAGDFQQLANQVDANGAVGHLDATAANAAQPGSLSGGRFNQVAGGDLINANPYREQAISAAQDQALNKIKATMSSRGRLGSTAYGDAAARALGEIGVNARMQGYDTDTANMLAAAQARSGENLALGGQRISAAGEMGGLQNALMNTRIGALQGQTGAESQAAQTRLSAAQSGADIAQGNRQLQLDAARNVSDIEGQNWQNKYTAAQGMLGQQNLDFENQLAARQALAGVQGQNAQTQLGAAQGLSGAQEANRQLQLQAAQGLTGLQNQQFANQRGVAQDMSAVYGQNFDQRLASQQALAGQQSQNYRDRLSAAQGLTGAQAQQGQLQLGAAQGLTGLQDANQQARLAAASGLAGVQQGNYDSRLAAQQGLTGAQNINFQNQMAALAGLTGNQQFQRQSQQGLLSQLSGVQGQNIQNQLAAAQGLTGVQGQNIQNQLAAAGLAPQMQQLRYDDMQRLLGVGATRESMAQQQRDFGWDQLGNYQGFIGGVPGSAGQQSQPGQPWWQQALGVGGALAGIYGAMNPAAGLF